MWGGAREEGQQGQAVCGVVCVCVHGVSVVCGVCCGGVVVCLVRVVVVVWWWSGRVVGCERGLWWCVWCVVVHVVSGGACGVCCERVLN